MSKKNIPLKIALVGCGRVSSKHFDGILNNSFFSLQACCDINLNVCESLRKKFPALKIFNSYELLLKQADIDLVVIATPSGLHSPMACQALLSGKDIVLEKPVALTVKDALKIKMASEKTNRKVSVVLQNRLNRVVLYTKKYASKLVKLNYISSNVFWYRPQDYYDDGWHGTKKMDKGTLMNQGTHYADMMLYLSGKKVKQVSAFGATLKHTMECEDTITVNIMFEDGTLGNVQVNTISYPKNAEGSVTLFYDQATIKIGGLALNKIVYWQGNGENDISVIEDTIDTIYGNGHGYFYNELARFYQGKIKTLPASLDEGIEVLKIIEAAYKSIEKNKNIRL
jgi:UDP-N-acetyl-2-amino-2-deoxyglucuronate dehydrogenase